MLIGVPKEIKIGETRVSMTPNLCRRGVSLGARVAMLVQKRVARALAEHPGLARGVNTQNGRIAYAAVAKTLG